jgi:hypothetical protein
VRSATRLEFSSDGWVFWVRDIWEIILLYFTLALWFNQTFSNFYCIVPSTLPYSNVTRLQLPQKKVADMHKHTIYLILKKKKTWCYYFFVDM